MSVQNDETSHCKFEYYESAEQDRHYGPDALNSFVTFMNQLLHLPLTEQRLKYMPNPEQRP